MMGKRIITLMGTLLVLYIGCAENRLWAQTETAHPSTAKQPLAGSNAISNVKVHQDQSGRWIAEFDYFYNGEPDHATLQIYPVADNDGGDPTVIIPLRGSHHVSGEIKRPIGDNTNSYAVVVELGIPTHKIARQVVSKDIAWPDIRTYWVNHEFATKSKEAMYDRAVSLIDTGNDDSLSLAKVILERLISNDSQFSPGYIQLARIALKSSDGLEGITQAENLLNSALKIQPDSSNAKILLGQVYNFQGRNKEAEELFIRVSQTRTKNLWLWVNWGLLLVKEGKIDQGIEKYRHAVAGERPHTNYDRARLTAYRKLINLYENKGDLDQAEALLKRRISEFGNADCNCVDHCFIGEYVSFLVNNRDDISKTIDMGRQALNSGCNKDVARHALGLAYYANWAHEKGKKRDNLLREARVFLPSSPSLLYQLATNDRTMIILKQLVAEGESLEQVDNKRNSALTYALGIQDNEAAKRLLTLGAKSDTTVTSANVPLALIPVLNGNIDGVRLMVQFGVDYSALRFNGVTAYQYAKQVGNTELLNALGPKAQGL